ncbi:MAG: response regulator [Rubrivivax sp.]|nr:response regulator [Rubrivivax sp.]
MIDRDLHLARALLVESNPLLRSTGVAQLRDMGIGHIAQATRAREARLLLERESFDIVVCSRELEGSDLSGQDLLDELRRERQLPQSTVFVMVTAQASYNQVVEAAESALDGFLVRPYTGAALAERVLEARQRKRELGDVLRALDAGDNEAALVRAIKRFQERQPYWSYCGRLAAELLLVLQRPGDARRVFERLSEALPTAAWARLGAARALVAQGEIAAARKATAELLESNPAMADAHDLMGRILVEQCEFDAALEEYRAAVDLTPGCLLRAQHAGALAFYQGRTDEALLWLERTLGMGVQSKLFDALTLLLVAMLRHERGDTAGVAAMGEQLRQFRERYPESKRLRRFERTSNVLHGLLAGRADAALAELRDLSTQTIDDDFDLEAANMLIAAWSRVPEGLRQAGEFEAVLERVALRYCTSRAITEVLAAAARRGEAAQAVIRAAQARLSSLGERAMDLALKGDPGTGVRELLAAGEQTANAKLLEMAGAIARRHEALIPDAAALCGRAAARLKRSCQAVNHIAGIQRSGRSPGGLQLRSAQPATEAAHAAA